MALQWWFLIFILCWGASGIFFARKTGFPEPFQAEISHFQRFGIAALHGTIFGIGSIIFDWIYPVAKLFELASAHQTFPVSIPFYIYGAIISEAFYHLLPLPLIIYVVSNKILKGKHQETVFWIAVSILSFWESRRFFVEPRLWSSLEFGRNMCTYFANFSELWLFRRYGFLAAVTQRLTCYLYFHILWPTIHPS